MERLKRSLSFRKKKDHVPECSKPHQWQEDERKVRDGTCSFQVRYLGCIEVFESRGIQICEEAVKALKQRQGRSVWSRMSLRRKKSKDKLQQCKGKYQRAILYVSGDAVRVVDEISKGLIVDQTIEKVSFCAPDRNQEKGFSYICRDGTTRRWMCHGFLALKESGERLSHAVGCAFALCLEKKQKREKDSVSVTFNQKGTSFTRTGSFRQTTMTERLVDPQSAIIAEPVPLKDAENPYAVQRPRPSEQMLQRQGSFRGFEKLSESSPFKRQLSLRLNELPSTLERQQQTKQGGFGQTNGPVSPIPEASPTKEKQEETAISDMCQQLSAGLSALSTEDPFSKAPGAANHQTAAVVHNAPTSDSIRASYQSAQPIQQNNPWAAPPPYHGGKVSDAEFWLSSTATSVRGSTDPFATGATTTTASTAPTMNGTTNHEVFSSPGQQVSTPQQQQQQLLVLQQQQQQQLFAAAPRMPPHISHLRSHSIDTAEMHSPWNSPAEKGPSLRELSQRPHVAQFQSQQNGSVSASTTTTNPWNSSPPRPRPGLSQDPFDAAWAAKASNQQNTNPFQTTDTVTKAFEVKL